MVHTLLSTRNVSNRAISFFVSVKSFPDDDDVVVCSRANSSACFGLCRCAATREIFPFVFVASHRVHFERSRLARCRLVVKVVVVVKEDDEEEEEDDIFSFFIFVFSLFFFFFYTRERCAHDLSTWYKALLKSSGHGWTQKQYQRDVKNVASSSKSSRARAVTRACTRDGRFVVSVDSLLHNIDVVPLCERSPKTKERHQQFQTTSLKTLNKYEQTLNNTEKKGSVLCSFVFF